MTAVALRTQGWTQARVATPLPNARSARLAISLAIASMLHAILIFGFDAPRFAPPPPATTIDLSLAVPGVVPMASPNPAAALPAAQRTGKPAASTPSEGEPEPQAPVADAPPNDSGQADFSIADTASPAPPASLAGRHLDDLVRAVAESTLTAEPLPAGRVFRLGETIPARTDFAYYLESWRRKVERIGKLNYPRQARAERITGSLRLRVAIDADGALRDVRVVRTSGHRLLDDAALRIVRLAAPYAPFSPAMRETTDVLEIERTWRFLNSGISS